MKSPKTKNRTIRKVLYYIKHNKWEEPIPRHFFKDPTVSKVDKINVLFLMSKKRLKFPQIDCTDKPEEIHQKLEELFGVGEEKLSILHVIACALNRKAEDVMKNFYDYKAIKNHLRKLNDYGESALHLACSKKASVEIIHKISDIGGRDLVLERDSGGYTALHNACICKASSENINCLLKIGGRELVMATARCGRTALHWACFHDVPYEIIDNLVRLGGKELVLASDTNHRKSIHIATVKRASIDTIRRLVDVGAKDILVCKNPLGDDYGHLFLHFFIATAWCCCEESAEKFLMLVLKGIEYNIGGEFSVGGLLNTAPADIQKHIYDCWIGRVDHCLDQVLKKHEDIALLHSVIMAKAPQHIIQNVTESHKNMISLRDSKSRYPIDVAVEGNLDWYKGLDKIFEATTKSSMNLKRHPINVAAFHCLRWGNGMKEVVDNASVIEINQQNYHLDEITNLYPFMLAAVGQNSDLDTIFELMRRNPELVN